MLHEPDHSRRSPVPPMIGDPAALPPPDPEAAALSTRLTALVRERIAAAGGAITFADYMGLALYAPGLGYYSAGSRKSYNFV